MFTFEVLALPLGFVTVALLTYLLMKVGSRKGLLDIPNERSSHESPVPRGGGLAFVVAFVLFIAVFPHLFSIQIEPAIRVSLLVGGTIVAIVGTFDDFSHVPAIWRFVAHVLAATLSLYLLPAIPAAPVFGISIDPGTFGFVFLIISLVWFVNLFNFMDGIDGIAGVEAITALAGGALIMGLLGQTDWLLLFGFLAACVAGFLVWNWPPANVFMGDAGSGFLGFVLGLLAIATSVDGVLNIWSWLILFGVFVVDATTTLATRLVRRERWLEAHRSHCYQILSRRYGGHWKVSVGVLVINIVWLLPLAFLAARYPYWAPASCFVALLPLFVICKKVGAGKREVEV